MKKEQKNTQKKTKKGNSIVVAFLNLIKVIVIVAAVIFVVNKAEVIMAQSQEPDITATFISEKLETVSELTTAKLTYNGLVRYSDGKIPFITKKAFSMSYCANVKAGVDLSKAVINISDKEVLIELPGVDVMDIVVDSDTIQFYDKKSAVFNWSKREDVVQALKTAEKDVENNADIDELKSSAKKQVDTLLNGLFKDIIGERTLKIVYK